MKFKHSNIKTHSAHDENNAHEHYNVCLKHILNIIIESLHHKLETKTFEMKDAIQMTKNQTKTPTLVRCTVYTLHFTLQIAYCTL